MMLGRHFLDLSENFLAINQVISYVKKVECENVHDFGVETFQSQNVFVLSVDYLFHVKDLSPPDLKLFNIRSFFL